MIPVDQAAILAEKSQVLSSRTFARSDQLQRFLRYVTDLELSGRGEEISEYSIATEALMRPPNYSSGDDSAVRSRAHALRRKLQEFYQSESPAFKLRIDLPKGCYRPVFVSHSEPLPVVQVQATPERAPKEVAARGTPISPRLAFVAGLSLAAVIAGIVLAVVTVRARTARMDPVIRDAWGSMLSAPGDVSIMLASPPVFGMISSKAGAPPQGLNMYPAPEIMANWYDTLNLAERGGPLYSFRSRAYPHIGDTLAMVTTTTLLTRAGITYSVVPEGSSNPAAMSSRGLVVVGSPTYSSFIARVMKATPLSIRFDPERNEEVIGDGGKRAFVPSRNRSTTYFSNVYGLITVLPSQPGRDRPERTIIFSGITGSSGAQAAAQFFTSAPAMKGFQERLAHDGYNGFPPAYQVVVRCGLDGFAALNAVYEAHQVIKDPPVIQ